MSRRVAILGCGKIGESLLGGLLSAGWRKPGEVVATVRREERIAELRGHYGIEVLQSNTEAVADAVYLLCLPEAGMITGHTLVVDAGYCISG